MQSIPPWQSSDDEASEQLDALLKLCDSLAKDGHHNTAYRLLKILQQSPCAKQPTEDRLRNIYREWIPHWHFGMLNDKNRCQAYADAIASLDLKDKIVFDLGAGSGFLSMLAARRGARHVYACEMVYPIAEKAVEIVRENGLASKITIIPKSSFQVAIGKDMPERAEVMLSETLDHAFVGEGFLSSLRHARQNLLRPDALLVPSGMRICGTLVESPAIYNQNYVHTTQGLDLSGMNEFSLQGHFAVYLTQQPHRMLSAVKTLLDTDFYVDLPESIACFTEFEAAHDGTVHGVVFWFQARLAPGVTLTNDFKYDSHWPQAVIAFHDPLAVQKGQRYRFELTMTDQTIDVVPEQIPVRD